MNLLLVKFSDCEELKGNSHKMSPSNRSIRTDCTLCLSTLVLALAINVTAAPTKSDGMDGSSAGKLDEITGGQQKINDGRGQQGDVMTLPDDVIIDALFTNIDTVQDQLEICEEGLRQKLVEPEYDDFEMSHNDFIHQVKDNDSSGKSRIITKNSNIVSDTATTFYKKQNDDDIDDDDDDDDEVEGTRDENSVISKNITNNSNIVNEAATTYYKKNNDGDIDDDDGDNDEVEGDRDDDRDENNINISNDGSVSSNETSITNPAIVVSFISTTDNNNSNNYNSSNNYNNDSNNITAPITSFDNDNNITVATPSAIIRNVNKTPITFDYEATTMSNVEIKDKKNENDSNVEEVGSKKNEASHETRVLITPGHADKHYHQLSRSRRHADSSNGGTKKEGQLRLEGTPTPSFSTPVHGELRRRQDNLQQEHYLHLTPYSGRLLTPTEAVVKRLSGRLEYLKQSLIDCHVLYNSLK